MRELISFQDTQLRQIENKFFRSLYKRIDWNERMLAVKGARGTGKTTLLLQYMKYGLNAEDRGKALYITADHYWFYSHVLFELVHDFYHNGGRFLFIDEVHKYPNWSRELKNIYDGFPDMRTVFSSSSALDIYRGEADLSRRVITYELSGMSFREYLELKGYGRFPILTLNEVVESHRSLSIDISEKFHPLPLFKLYLMRGYFPMFEQTPENHEGIKLMQVLNAVLESDLAYIQNYNSGVAHKIKNLLAIIAESVPFKPNISALARKLDVSRDSVYEWLQLLEKARMLNLLKVSGKGVSLLQKPDKIYLENTNLAYAFTQDPDVGSIRESFFLNQLRNAGYTVHAAPKGDFLVDQKWTFEVGGRNKNKEQIQDIENSFLAVDRIETGFGNTIPLWLFGFLY